MVFFEVDSRQYIPCAFMKEGSEKKKEKKKCTVGSIQPQNDCLFSFHFWHFSVFGILLKNIYVHYLSINIVLVCFG